MFDHRSVNVAEHNCLTALLIHRGEQHSALQTLRTAGFRIVEALGIRDAVNYVRSCGPRLVIVGEGLSIGNGPDLLSVLRGLTVAPIVVVGSGGQHSLVRALEQGADAYVDQSVTPVVFLARVRAMLRRYAQVNVSSNGAV